MPDELRCLQCGKMVGSDISSQGLCDECVRQLSTAGEAAPSASAGEPAALRLDQFVPPAQLDRVGPFKILETLGEGGMGIVYLAEQEAPIRRRVALKLIKWGMDTKGVIARFESERQALALMNHPNIARVLDAGSTETGRPYFVMEYVPGIAITDYCDKNQLDTAERLRIFMQVCDGVQHAHQRGIIHRDLKPSNVLVMLQDQMPVPKIIDFGVAKAAAQRLTEHTVYTELGQLIGTPAYMSPEQAEMTGLDVDTRTDVYSLGALLFELLVGTPPYNPRELRRLSLDEVRRRIREEDPPKPSTRFSTLGEVSAATAKRRGADAVSLARQLRGDLDWITMKCLEKDRTRRYAAASELSADILRHLRHEPVLASPPSRIYRMQKFVRRHRLGVASAAVVLLALLAGTIGITAGLLRAVRAERRANEEAQASKQVSDFLTNLFQVSDPSEARGNTITVREVLDRGAEKVNRDLADQPKIRSRMLYTMGRVYRNLGLYKTSAQLLEEGLRVARGSLGPEHPDIATCALELAWLYRMQGKSAEAASLCKEALAIREKTLGPNHPGNAWALMILGTVARDKGDYQEAEKLLRRSLELREKGLGPDHAETASSLYHLGWLKKLTGNFTEARQHYERALAIWEKQLGPDHPYVAWCLNDLSVVSENTGNFEEARRLLQRSLDLKVRVLGPEHPDVAATLNNMGVLLWRLRDYAAARTTYERALAIREKALGPEHGDVGGTLYNLGLLCLDTGEYEQAHKYYERALHIQEKLRGPDHDEVASTCFDLAEALEKLKQFDLARSYCERALSIKERVFGAEHGEVATVLYMLANICSMQGKYTEAEPLFQRALKIREKTLEPQSPILADTLSAYAALLRKTDRIGEAEKLELRAKTIRQNAAPKSAAK